MIIQLNHVLPIPLKERLLQSVSDVWNTALQWEPGEYIKIKAPSGSGKTTLIHSLYKLRTDYTGLISFDKQSLTAITESLLAETRQQKLSIVFQDLRLFPNLTARENIELKRVLQKPFYPKEVIESMAEELGISHVLEQRAGLCSYGEQQRVAIIRALVQPFSWLIMDEPFSHLDNNNISKAAALINSECKKRTAGLLVTDLEDDHHFAYTRVLNL